ncbi:hypothetical protein Pla175_27920 [Pirellulimonas nuda]|uniref:SWIM-type domain-containing protein n=1 Tax=Pirellulimonas nuda TaxID=2528009 RepID=A0A518DD40_9BACT|nr:hypothetical protein [Pirellulimonas nuda]QDU89402.1 hypothetical protein Pla175_27920 [Pirellulimonas nuda]
MPRKKTSAPRLDPPNAVAATPHAAAWAKLTWEDLDRAFDKRSVQRGRSYQRGGQVKNLGVSSDGRLLAAVRGTRSYITSAQLDPSRKPRDRITGACTCPVGNQCKHAVAVIAEYLAQVADGKTPPAAADDDSRWARLAGSAVDRYAGEEASFDDAAGDVGDNEDGADADDSLRSAVIGPRGDARRRARGSSGKAKRAGSAPKTPRRSRAEWDALIRADVVKKPPDELATLVLALVNRFPELRQEFQERILLAEGDAPRLIGEARNELRSVTSEIGWQNHWQHDGHTPDYSRLKHRLERLAELGHADAVVDLGRELLERGMSQVGQSHDEGETGLALAECFPVLFAAVAASSLAPAEKILYAIDACELDQWDYVGQPAATILAARRTRADWSAVADVLVGRLYPSSPQCGDDDAGADDDAVSDRWTRNYRRDSLSNWLVKALEKAGRQDETLSVFEAEARRTGSYERLVDHLMRLKRFDDAERWAREGIEQTRARLPGSAAHLADRLVDLARGRKQWDIVAARAACEFFRRPSVRSFRDLVGAAEKAKCGPAVRRRAEQFLETGIAPIRCEAAPAKAAKTAVKKKGAGSAKRRVAAAAPSPPTLRFSSETGWPLPLPDYLAAAFLSPPGPFDRQRNYRNVLVDLAIAEKKPDEALRWYDAIVDDETPKSGRAPRATASDATAALASRVAAAVAKSHPERALEVYRRELEMHLPHANQGAYESAADCLRKMRPVLRSLDRDNIWTELVKHIREKYRNRPRFMEVLDKLERRRIVASPKRRR